MLECMLPFLAAAIIIAGFIALGFIVDPEGMEIFLESIWEDINKP